MILTQEQISQLSDLIDEAEVYIGASLQSNNPMYILKAINDEIKSDGVDWQYDLNSKGEKLQKLYEEIFKQNEVKK